MAGRFTVLICQHRLLHYRVDFFEKLRAMAESRDVRIRLLHGQASAAEALKNDEGRLDWAERVENRWACLGGVDVLWQPVFRRALKTDLVVLMQENRILSNYLVMLWRRLAGRPLVAYWGHGANFQSRAPGGLRERWKRLLSTQVDFWFAYTQATADLLLDVGYPGERIANLNNTMDTRAFRALLDAVPEERLRELRASLGIAEGAPVGLMCGSLYPDKRTDLLVAAGDILRARLPDFHLIVIGSGPSLPELELAAASRDWLHLAGVRKGREKAEYFRLAQVMLNPGLAGLHILDSFAAGLPFITTRTARHSPEIVYLDGGRRGVLTGDSPDAYASAVVELMQSPERLREMTAAALDAADRFTVEAMAGNFLAGIEACRRLGRKERD